MRAREGEIMRLRECDRKQVFLHFWSFQVTVGSGRPTAKQNRLTLSPSFTDTSRETLTIRAGTGRQETDL